LPTEAIELIDTLVRKKLNGVNFESIKKEISLGDISSINP
jgi:hypothetical protein